MCGRFSARYSWSELHHLYRLSDGVPALNLEPRYNVTPTTRMPIVRDRDGDGREVVMARWGLVPPWHKGDIKKARMLNNARCETAATLATFRGPFRGRRCIVPASGFYEWLTVGKEKLPFNIEGGDGSILSMAGLWDRWDPRDGTSAVESFTILTTGPNKQMLPIHDRMPVFLDPPQFDDWLNVDTHPDTLQAMMKPYRDDRLIAYRVSTRVNSNRNEGADLIEPLADDDPVPRQAMLI